MSRLKKRPRPGENAGGVNGDVGALASREIKVLTAKIEGLEKNVDEMRGDLNKVVNLLVGRGGGPT